jgi:radical SAM superfamily enzyme YgiQ (UPF0313 family)
MKVLFIYSFFGAISRRTPIKSPAFVPFGVSLLSSFLKQYGHETRVLVTSRIFGDKYKASIDEYLQEFYPKVIGFTAVSTEFPFMAEAAHYIKQKYPDIFLLIGGAHVSLNAKDISLDDFNALCIGEGEYPMLELVSSLENGKHPTGIPNLWIKQGKVIEKNPPRPFIEDLDSLPFADREIWEEWVDDNALYSQHAGITVLLGRGCPFECTYCSNHVLKKLAAGRYTRFRSPDNIIQEIAQIHEKYPENTEIYLEVETFGVNREWAIKLCSKLEQLNLTLNKSLQFGVNLRVTPKMDVNNLFSAMARSNFKHINIGLESGNERVRKDILKRNYSNQDIFDVVFTARKYGLKVKVYNLIGIPGETITEFYDTVAMNRVCQPDANYTSIFYPYPGTSLYHLCEERKLLPEELDTESERTKAQLDLPGFTKNQIQRSYIWFEYYVYKGIRPLHKILFKVLVTLIRSSPFLYRLFRRFDNFANISILKPFLLQ